MKGERKPSGQPNLVFHSFQKNDLTTCRELDVGMLDEWAKIFEVIMSAPKLEHNCPNWHPGHMCFSNSDGRMHRSGRCVSSLVFARYIKQGIEQICTDTAAASG